MNKDMVTIKKFDYQVSQKRDNRHAIDVDKYLKAINREVNKIYKKAPDLWQNLISTEEKKITTELKIDDKIHKLHKEQAFITVKQRKDDFPDKPHYRLFNSSNNDIGKVSRAMLEKACIYTKIV